MEPTLTRQQVREVDRRAIEDLGVPGVVLMENAARHAADTVLDLLEDELHLVAADAQVGVLCGGGNNGGDGYALARHLHNHGVAVTLCAAVPVADLQGDARTNADICVRLGLPVVNVADDAAAAQAALQWPRMHVLVDALLGTGFRGQVRPPVADLIAHCNAVRARHGVRVVAVDVPSGLDCDTGEAASLAIEADLTVTFVAMKAGFAHAAAELYVGRVIVADIGVPTLWALRVASDAADLH